MPNNAFRGLAAILSFALLAVSGARAQQPRPPDDEVKKRLEALEAGQRAIQKQLDDIMALLRAQADAGGGAPAVPLPSELPVSGAAVRGKATAPLTLIEFSDFQCPYCGQQARATLPAVMKDYVDSGKVRYVFRNFPIQSIHPNAFHAAEAAGCAGQQGKGWEMHDKLFANQTTLAPANLLAFAGSLGLDMPKFQACMAGAVAPAIRQDLAMGAAAGVNSTPTMFVGRTEPNGSVKIIRKLIGVQTPAALKATIEGLLSAPAK